MRSLLALSLGLAILTAAATATMAAAPMPIQPGAQPGDAPLSRPAALGRRIFFDPALSASGKLSCASCHDPANAYAAPASARVVMRGGADGSRAGLRTVPSLRYLTNTPRFARHTYVDTGREREDIGPAGGFMLDGRADNLQAQVVVPLLDPAEMDNTNIAAIASRLRRTTYAKDLEALARAEAGKVPPIDAAISGTLPLKRASPLEAALVATAAAAVERFEIEDPSFHPYSSRFDQFLRGAGTLTPEESAGLELFTNPNKGNCIACHTAVSGPGGQPPVFTDYSYHALGVPRNPLIAANRDPRFFDLGLCGPKRVDLKDEHLYCGYFKTPSLRNVARRRFFFHNGRFTTLEDVMHFYVERDTDPRRWYPTIDGRLVKFDDLPVPYRGNVNISDAPLNRERGQQPALNEEEIRQVIAFLGTLSDAD